MEPTSEGVKVFEIHEQPNNQKIRASSSTVDVLTNIFLEAARVTPIHSFPISQQGSVSSNNLKIEKILFDDRIEEINSVLKKIPKFESNNRDLEKAKDWIKEKIKRLVKKYSEICNDLADEEIKVLQEKLIPIFKQCILMLINSRPIPSIGTLINLLKKISHPSENSLVKLFKKISQEFLYTHRNDLMYTPWSFVRTTIKTAFESYLYENVGFKCDYQLGNPLVEPILWKILFKDEETFTLFMRCTNSIGHFSTLLPLFLNTMAEMREDQTTFESLVCYHYGFLKSKVIPNLKTLGLNTNVITKIETAWDAFHLTLPPFVSPPSWIEQDLETKNLLINLYSFTNRRLYPNALPEKLADVATDKVEWISSILNSTFESYDPQKYLELLKDSNCTRYALKAFLLKKITLNQFSSLCMAWSAVNTYDPKLESTKIYHVDDPHIKPYYHKNMEKSKNSTIANQAIHMVKQSTPYSEQFVVLLDLETPRLLNPNPTNSALMNLVSGFKYFLFPNKNHWIIPTMTLMKSILEASFGPQHAQPIPCLGDFPPRLLGESLKSGNRRFQISMRGVGNFHIADGFKTASPNLLADKTRNVNDPSLWLHDLFHLFVMGCIPYAHRLLFSELADFFMDLASKSDDLTIKKTYNSAYNKIVDVVFFAYEKASEADKVNGFPVAFKKSLEEISKDNQRLIKAINEFLKNKSLNFIDPLASKDDYK